MIPFLLAAAGGYLIAQSRKDDSLYEDGGLMKDFEKNFTTAYILQQQMAEKEKVQGVAHDSYDTTYYNQKYYPIRYHDGQAFASKELYNDLRDSSGNIKGDDEREVEEKVTAYFDEPDVKKLSGSTLHDMWKNGEGILVEKKKKKSWFFEEGGMTDEIKEGDVLEADYEKEYINYYKVVSINKENPKYIIVTFQNVNPTQKEITQSLSSLNDEIKQGKYELVTKIIKNGYSTGSYIQKQNNIVREGNYLKEVVEKQPVFRVTFFDEGRNEWSLRDTYDESLERIGNETIKEMIESGSLQRKLNKVFYKKGGTIQRLADFDISNLDDYEKMRYDSLIKSVPKEKALQILINDVEGDYSQLSPKLRSVANRYMAKGGKVDRYYIDYLNKKKNFKQDRKYFDSYNSAFSWAMKNFERFDRDMIKIE